MNWGFHFLGALFVLFPGFVAYVAFVAASRHSHLSLTERPNALASSMLILLGALFAHTGAAILFWLQESWTYLGWFPNISLGFDPNPYKVFLTTDFTESPSQNRSELQNVSGFIAYVLISSLVLGLVVCRIAFRAGESESLRNFVRPELIGWALELADKVAGPDQLVTAYVVTKSVHGEYFAGYEGMVEKISLGSDGQVTSLVLLEVDRFVVRVHSRGVVRPRIDETTPMELLVIDGREISNASFSEINLELLPGYDPKKVTEALERRA